MSRPCTQSQPQLQLQVPSQVDVNKQSDDKPYVALYEGYNHKNLAYHFAPHSIDYNSYDINRGYIRQIIKCNLKSLDINLPRIGNAYDTIRRVDIWAVDERDNSTASSESGFYNSYLEPDLELRSNPSRYRKIIQVLPGNRVKMEITKPVKKIYLIAII